MEQNLNFQEGSSSIKISESSNIDFSQTYHSKSYRDSIPRIRKDMSAKKSDTNIGTIKSLYCLKTPAFLENALVEHDDKLIFQKCAKSCQEKRVFKHKFAKKDILIAKIIDNVLENFESLLKNKKLIVINQENILCNIDEEIVRRYITNDIKTIEKITEINGVKKEISIREFFRLQNATEFPRLLFSSYYDTTKNDFFYEIDALFYSTKNIELPQNIFFQKGLKDDYTIKKDTLIIFEIKSSWVAKDDNFIGGKNYLNKNNYTADKAAKFITTSDNFITHLKNAKIIKKNVNIYRAIAYNGADGANIEKEIEKYKDKLKFFYFHENKLEKYVYEKKIKLNEKIFQDDSELKIKKERENFNKELEFRILEKENYNKESESRMKLDRENFKEEIELIKKELESKKKIEEIFQEKEKQNKEESESRMKLDRENFKEEIELMKKELESQMKEIEKKIQEESEEKVKKQEKKFAKLTGIIIIILIVFVMCIFFGSSKFQN